MNKQVNTEQQEKKVTFNNEPLTQENGDPSNGGNGDSNLKPQQEKIKTGNEKESET